MKLLLVERRFHVTTVKVNEEIWAEPGDIITVKDRSAEEYFIKKLNKRSIFSIWKRKMWIDLHCKPINKQK
jgi:hypothetical protein